MNKRDVPLSDFSGSPARPVSRPSIGRPILVAGMILSASAIMATHAAFAQRSPTAVMYTGRLCERGDPQEVSLRAESGLLRIAVDCTHGRRTSRKRSRDTRTLHLGPVRIKPAAFN